MHVHEFNRVSQKAAHGYSNNEHMRMHMCRRYGVGVKW